MSWLFGMNKKPEVPIMDSDDILKAAAGQGGGGGTAVEGGGAGAGQPGRKPKSEGYRSDAYSFGSTALERAASAAKV